MQNIFSKKTILYLLFAFLSLPAFSQDSTTSTKHVKNFSTFSIGVNAGVLAPISPAGGSNDFTKWKPTFGYGLNIKNQFTHYLGVEAEFLKGTSIGTSFLCTREFKLVSKITHSDLVPSEYVNNP